MSMLEEVGAGRVRKAVCMRFVIIFHSPLLNNINKTTLSIMPAVNNSS